MFNAVEINSSFYRPHRPATYQRWAASVAASFRFAVKVPKEITHAKRLADVVEELDRFGGQCGALGDRLGPFLVQLPLSVRYQPDVAPVLCCPAGAVRRTRGLRAAARKLVHAAR